MSETARELLSRATASIYVASSWRNIREQQFIVALLREAGHEVYDFVGDGGFQWSDVDPKWESWSLPVYRGSLSHPLAVEGFKCDMDALRAADTTVLVLPCNRSAHLELGYAVGAGQRTAVYKPPSVPLEPELMYAMVDLVTDDADELLAYLSIPEAGPE